VVGRIGSVLGSWIAGEGGTGLALFFLSFVLGLIGFVGLLFIVRIVLFCMSACGQVCRYCDLALDLVGGGYAVFGFFLFIVHCMLNGFYFSRKVLFLFFIFIFIFLLWEWIRLQCADDGYDILF